MPDTVAVKRALARLATTERDPVDADSKATDQGDPEASVAPVSEATADPRTTVERAVAATESTEAAAAFVADGGLDSLAAALDRVADDALRADGRRALRTLRRLRAAARGADHFHSGRGTVIRRREQGEGT